MLESDVLPVVNCRPTMFLAVRIEMAARALTSIFEVTELVHVKTVAKDTVIQW